MPRSEWTSKTLPKMPPVEDIDQRHDLWFARAEARADLFRAEALEAQATKARLLATTSSQHYQDLLEEQASYGTLLDG